MKIYNYHPDTKEYLGDSLANPNPLEPGNYLIPAHATPIPPINTGKNQVAVFVNNEWVIKSDFRGKKYIKAGTFEEVTINEIGIVPEGEATTQEIQAKNQEEQEQKGQQKKEAQKKQLIQQGLQAFMPVIKAIVKNPELLQDVKAKVPSDKLQQLEKVINELEAL